MEDTLKDLRDTWERGLNVKAVISRPNTVLVILADEYVHYNRAFHLNRYFTITQKKLWTISVDLQNGSLENVYQTLSRLLLTSSSWSVNLIDFKL